MFQSCTKFRVFNVLLVFCLLLNVVIFRKFFQSGLQVWTSGTSQRYNINSSAIVFTLSDSSSLYPTHNSFLASGVKNGGNRTKSEIGGSSASKENGVVAKTVFRIPLTDTKENHSGRTNSAVSAVFHGGANVKDSKSDVTKSRDAKNDHDVTKSVRDVTKSNVTVAQSVAERLEIVEGPGRPLEAWGKLVKPRANVKAPWARDNTTTPCPLVPPNLVGPLATYKDSPNFTEIVRLNPGLEPGGHYHPPDCRARHRVAVIVPYRDRELHLRTLLHNLHPMLMRQQLDYFILVVELELPTLFNRGLLLNIGAIEALGLWDVQCFVLHDVDLVPENDKNLYTCPEMPRHLSAAVDKFNYRLPYQGIFGGVTVLRREHFYKINGYSNVYFGWGGEDDDLSGRVRGSGLKVTRYSMNVARYKMFKHGRDKKNEPNPKRFQMLKQWKKRQATDGLNSIEYEVKKLEFREGYTWLLVSVDQAKILKS